MCVCVCVCVCVCACAYILLCVHACVQITKFVYDGVVYVCVTLCEFLFLLWL